MRAPVLRTALVLDDEPELRQETCDELERRAVEVQQAATVGEAIRKLAARPYDLVLCDVVLCEPPGTATPAPRGYLAVCYALARHPASVVVQASTLQRWQHPGAVLTTGSAQEVADLVHGAQGVRAEGDSGCPWAKLLEAEAAAPGQRPEAARSLLRLPVMEELRRSLGLADAFEAVELAAHDGSAWRRALCDLRSALFPGSSDGA